MEYATLINGIKMPILGYGVYQVKKEEYKNCVLEALECGYRHIDTAQSILMKKKLVKLIKNLKSIEKNYSSHQKYGLNIMDMKNAKNPF